jgi:hypothetical protein
MQFIALLSNYDKKPLDPPWDNWLGLKLASGSSLSSASDTIFKADSNSSIEAGAPRHNRMPDGVPLSGARYVGGAMLTPCKQPC